MNSKLTSSLFIQPSSGPSELSTDLQILLVYWCHCKLKIDFVFFVWLPLKYTKFCPEKVRFFYFNHPFKLWFTKLYYTKMFKKFWGYVNLTIPFSVGLRTKPNRSSEQTPHLGPGLLSSCQQLAKFKQVCFGRTTEVEATSDGHVSKVQQPVK